MATWATFTSAAVIVHGSVSADHYDVDDCPRAQGDPSNGDTVCSKMATEIQHRDRLTGIFVTAVRVEAGPNAGTNGTLELQLTCVFNGQYRSYFEQLVTHPGGQAWNDARWDTSPLQVNLCPC